MASKLNYFSDFYEEEISNGIVPELYIDKDLLTKENICFKKKNHKVYRINGDWFYEEDRNQNDLQEFWLELIDQNEDYEDLIFEFDIKQNSFVVLVNSIILLSCYQWNTITDEYPPECLVCDIITEDPSGHIKTDDHIINLEKHKPLKKFNLHITRLIGVQYHCTVCNELFEIYNDTHLDSERHLERMLYATNRATDSVFDFDINNDYQSVNNDNDANEGNKDIVSTSESGFDSDGFYDSNYFNSNKSTLRSYASIVKGHTSTSVVGNKTLSIESDTYHMILRPNNKEFYCMLCIRFDDVINSSDHCKSEEHLRKLKQCEVMDIHEEHFIRKVTTKFYHCGTCNNLQLAGEVEAHLDAHRKKHENNGKGNEQENKTNDNSDEVNVHENKTNENNKVNVQENKTTENNNKVNVQENKTNENNKVNVQENKTNENNKVNVQENKTTENNNKVNVQENKTNENNKVNVHENKTNENNKVNVQENKTTENNNKVNVQENKTNENNKVNVHENKTNENNKVNVQENKTTENNNKVNVQENKTNENNNKVLNINKHRTQNSQLNVSPGPWVNNPSVHHNIVINVFNSNIRVSIMSYNLVLRRSMDYICLLCNFVSPDMTMHLRDPRHGVCLQNIPFQPFFGIHLVRMIQQYAHCGICNILVNAAVIHLHTSCQPHLYLLNKALNPINNNIVMNQTNTDSIQSVNTKQSTDVNIPSSSNNVQAIPTNTETLNQSGTESAINQTIDLNQTELDSDDLEYDIEDNLDILKEFVYLKLKKSLIKVSYVSYNTLVHTGDGNRYCFVCSYKVTKSLRGHIKSKAHMNRMIKCRFVTNYEKDLLRQIKLTYHCCICNVLVKKSEIKSHLLWPVHKEKASFQKIRKRLHLNNTINAEFQTKDTCPNEKEPQMQLVFKMMSGKKTKDNIGGIVINIPPHQECRGKIFNISWDAWQGITRYEHGVHCNLCHDFFVDIDAHLEEESHKKLVSTPIERQYLPACIRKIMVECSQITEVVLNCITCNLVFSNKGKSISQHVAGRKHLMNYEDILQTAFTDVSVT